MARACPFNTNNGILRYIVKCPGCKSSHVFTTGFESEQAKADYIKSRESMGPGHQPCPVWGFDGNLDLPTFTPSMLATWGGWDEKNSKGEVIRHIPKSCCHSFVTNGRIQFLGDCTHDMANQTVDLPEWPEDEK